jgi:putative SOS response-associated peptidase YedK
VPELAPRFRIAPQQRIPVVRVGAGASTRVFDSLPWGSAPAGDRPFAGRPIVAAADNVVGVDRCLVVADGFYNSFCVEGTPDGRRVRFCIRMKDDRPFAFAGVCSRLGGGPPAIEFCSVITTDANTLISPIHDRMPAIVPPGRYDLWLDPSVDDPGQLAEILKPYPSAEMQREPILDLREQFASVYQGKPIWDIDGPQPAFVRLEECGRIRGAVVDLGCGTGENALYLAARGHVVCGIDYVALPIERAKTKARARGLTVDFRVGNAFDLHELRGRFDTAIDCGLFHLFNDEERAAYVTGLAAVLGAGGRFHMLCFSDLEPPGEGPRRVSRQEIYDTFRDGWEVEDVQAVTIENVTDADAPWLHSSGPAGWLTTVVCKRG